MLRVALGLVVVAAAAFAGAARHTPARADDEPFRQGDIFVSGFGTVAHVNPLFDTVDSFTPGVGDCMCGMAFDGDGNLDIATESSVVQIAPDGTYSGALFSSSGALSIAIDGDGNVFVGGADGHVREYDSGGSLQENYTVDQGDGDEYIDSIALAGDSCTMFYSNDDTVLHRYDVCLGEQLDDFGSGITAAAGIAILSGGDVLVADTDVIHRFGSGGDDVQDYGTPSSGVYWRAVAVNADETAIVANNGADTNLHSFDLETGDETDITFSGVDNGEVTTSGDYLAVYAGPTVLPQETKSYYVTTLDSGTSPDEDSVPYQRGCETREDVKHGVVILDFGQPYYDDGYITMLPSSNTEADLASIETAIKRFVEGYADCSGLASSPTLRLIVAVNNYGVQLDGVSLEDPDYTTSGHGAAWADMLADVRYWIEGTAMLGDVVAISGGIDAETGWNDATRTLSWADGFTGESTGLSYYDIGSANDCPDDGTGTDPIPDCSHSEELSWSQDDRWMLAWGHSGARALPEIYHEANYDHPLGRDADVWFWISEYGYEAYTYPIQFSGVLTQYAACQYDYEHSTADPQEYPAECIGAQLTSALAYDDLWARINDSGSPETWGYIPARTDIDWTWEGS